MEIKKIFKYRNIWMAFAILWIMLFHSSININSVIFNEIKKIGYGGVDIFLLASGLGCYFSLEKDSDIYNFIKKRFLKLMPTYWIFLLFYFIFKFITSQISINSIIGNIFCIQNFTGLSNDFNWYMSAIWLLYFLAPYLKKIVDRIDNHKQFLAILCIFLILSIAFWNSNILIITITRIPIFFVGMYIAKYSQDFEQLTKTRFKILIFLMLLGFFILKIFFEIYHSKMWSHGLYWYPFILITPGLCLVISYLCQKIDEYSIGRKILKVFQKIGNNTFEIYLVHIPLYELISLLIKKGFLPKRNLTWLFTVIL